VKGFDLYIVGHYHEPFVLTTPEGKDVINPGVVLRGRADEKDIQSKLVIFDTETKSVEFVDIPQARNVFVERVETVLEHVVYTLRDLQHITLSNWLEEAPEDIKPILMEYVTKIK
jgi:DNA repair exonuclease SbcCD nuclease subunit